MGETIINGIIEVSQEVVGQLQYDIGVKGDTGDSSVYHAGQLNVIENTSTLKKSVSGSVILIDDVSPVTHNMEVKISSIPKKNLLNRLIAKAHNSSDMNVPTEDFINTYCSKKISFKQGITYTFSIKSVSGFSDGVAWAPRFYIFDNGSLFVSNATSPPVVFSTDFFTSDSSENEYTCYNGSALWSKANMIGNQGPWSMTITPVKDFEAVFIVTDGAVTDNVIITEAQIEVGSTATSYAPYIENPITDLTAVTIRKQGKNLIPFPYRELKLGTSTYNGVNFTVYEDGSILINGTATSSITRYLYNNTTDLLGLKSGITISGSKNASDNTQQANVYLICNYYNSAAIMQQGLVVSIVASEKTTITDDWKGLGIYLHIPSGKTLNNLLIKPQLEIGTTTTTYEPYIIPTDYTPNADGTVEGITSLYPSTTLMTDTEGVIIDCEYYKDIDVDDVIERTVTTYTNPKVKIIGGYTFYNCKSLITADFPAATNVGTYAFTDCTSLTTINFPIAMSIGTYTFRNCKSLITADFPAATSIGTYAFANCTSLATADFPIAMSMEGSAFNGCTALTTINFPAVTSIKNSTFTSCTSLTTINFPVATSIENNAFRNCKSLITADFPVATRISTYAFYSCSALTALILRNSTICTLSNKNAFDGCTHITGTGGYIYVPSSLIDTYKTATNWVTYASKFRALEDYTVDGTTTGALDESKVSA